MKFNATKKNPKKMFLLLTLTLITTMLLLTINAQAQSTLAATAGYHNISYVNTITNMNNPAHAVVVSSGLIVSGSSVHLNDGSNRMTLGLGPITDSAGTSVGADDTYIRTRFRSSSGSHHVHTVFRDAGGIILYGPQGTGEIFRINNDGSVGIGTASPQSKLHVTDRVELSRMGTVGTYASNQVQQIWSIGRGYNIDTTANDFGTSYGITYAHTNAGTNTAKKPIAGWGHQILFTNSGTRNAVISLTSGHGYFAGNVGIGTTSPSHKLHVDGNVGATAFIYDSDVNLKENLILLDDSLSKLKGLNTYSFNFINSEEQKLGVLAQELKTLFPELVFENAEGTLGVDYPSLIVPVIQAVQEQQKMLEQQQRQIEIQQELLEEQQKQIDELKNN